MPKLYCNLDKSVLIKIVLLISIIFLIAYILNYASSNKLMEALTTQCGCRGPNFVPADSGCGSVGAPCCREPNKADPQPLCKDGPCGCYEGYLPVKSEACVGSVQEQGVIAFVKTTDFSANSSISGVVFFS